MLKYQARFIALAGFFMKFKIFLVALDQCGNIFDYQHILRIEMGGGIAEVETSRDDDAIINEHDFVMGNQITVINIRRNSGGVDGIEAGADETAVGMRAIIFALHIGTVQNNCNSDSAFSGVYQGLDNGLAGEAVGLNLNTFLGGVNQMHQFTCGTAIRREKNC